MQARPTDKGVPPRKVPCVADRYWMICRKLPRMRSLKLVEFLTFDILVTAMGSAVSNDQSDQVIDEGPSHEKIHPARALFGAGGAAGWTLSRAFGPNLPVYDGTRRIAPGAGETTLNDASGLSPTPIHKHMVVKQDPDDALIAIVRQELAAARKDGRPLNVGAARIPWGAGHSPQRHGHHL